MKFKSLTKTLNLSNDDFIRTTEKRHYKAVNEIWNRLVNSNDIYFQNIKVGILFLTKLIMMMKKLKLKIIIKFLKVSGSKVEWVEEESFFLNYPLGKINLLNFYNDNPDFILPKSRRNEVVEFVKSGLKDLSVSRTSFTWGIPVPKHKSM